MPLSPAAIALLKALPTESGNRNLFIGARGDRTSQAAITVLPKRLGFEATVHGFRSTFADWCHERTGANAMLVEMSLAHSVGSDVERSYRRTDLFEKRAKVDGRLGRFRHLAGSRKRRRGTDAPRHTPRLTSAPLAYRKAVHIFRVSFIPS